MGVSVRKKLPAALTLVTSSKTTEWRPHPFERNLLDRPLANGPDLVLRRTLQFTDTSDHIRRVGLLRVHNNILKALKTGAPPLSGKSMAETCYWPSGVRGTDGVTLALALVWNLRTCPALKREKARCDKKP